MGLERFKFSDFSFQLSAFSFLLFNVASHEFRCQQAWKR
jgi:hypothetical protein